MTRAGRGGQFGLPVVAALGIAAASSAIAEDKVGIEVCDTFLDKYEACLKDKSGAQRAQFDQMISHLRTTWRQMARDEQTKPTLEDACKQTLESVKHSLNSAPYNCGF